MESAFFNTLINAVGGDVHPTALFSRHEICEPALQRVGPGAVTSWKAWLQPHTYDGHTLVLGTIGLGARSQVLPGSCMFPFTDAAEGAIVGRKTLVMKSESLPANTFWAGVPAITVNPVSDPRFAPFDKQSQGQGSWRTAGSWRQQSVRVASG